MIKHSITLTAECNSCLNTFLQAIKYQFTDMVQYYDNSLYFENIKGDEVQTYIDAFTCAAAEITNDIEMSPDVNIIRKPINPTTTSNFKLGNVWVNQLTGILYTCIDETIDKNIWISSDGKTIIQSIPTVDKFDFFEDGSALSFHRLDGNTDDQGGAYCGVESGTINWNEGVEHLASNSDKNGSIKISTPYDETTSVVTVAGWVQWNGHTGVMPYGWEDYSVYCYRGDIGFSTSNGDIFGIKFEDYSKKWIYLISTFKKGETGSININGLDQTLTQIRGVFDPTKANISNEFSIFGRGSGTSYRKFGTVDRLRIISRELTSAEKNTLATTEIEYINKITNGELL